MAQGENEIVGEVLREYRSRTDLSQEDAAHTAGLHRAQYGRYEQGRNAVTFVVMLRIAKALGVSIDELAAAVTRRLPKRPKR
jgi:transcriptional regulator with XRE-family HTH domain